MKSYIKIGQGLFVAAILIFVSCTQGFAITTLMAIRSWTAPDYTRVVFDLDRPLLFQENVTKDPRQINLEFRNCRNRILNDRCKIESPLIKSLRLENSSANSLIVKISLIDPTQYHIFYLQKYKTKPDRIVIDIKNPSYARQEQETTEEIKDLKESNWIVVIDPGHGGEDPGAVWKRRYREKDIVLSVGKILRDSLNKQPSVKAYLTREGDYFLSLRERIKVAHKYHADLFLSLHANASRRNSARGSSVYYLSRDGATDEVAALLAERENASDKIGGIPLGKDNTLDSILIDLAQTHTINESIDLGEKLLGDLTRIKGLRREGLKCANFGVLKSPSIPSVLVELAYLTNSSDQKLLLEKRCQSEMAQMLCKGVGRFLKGRPCKEKSKPTYAKADSYNHNHGFKIHVVQKGETLWRIASIYGIPLDILRELNGLDVISTILVGQKLKIPGSE